jgi:hypothetical protein
MYIHFIGIFKTEENFHFLPTDCFYLMVSTRVAFLLVRNTKTEKCTKSTQNVPNGHKLSQMAIKYVNIFHSEALQNLPKLGFLV